MGVIDVLLPSPLCFSDYNWSPANPDYRRASIGEASIGKASFVSSAVHFHASPSCVFPSFAFSFTVDLHFGSWSAGVSKYALATVCESRTVLQKRKPILACTALTDH